MNQLARAFAGNGHYGADLDPLNLAEALKEVALNQYSHPSGAEKSLLDPAYYGFGEKDMDRTFYIDTPQSGGILARQKTWKLRDLLQALRTAYCGKVGVEYTHIEDPTQQLYLRDMFELRQYHSISNDAKVKMLDRYYWTDGFANFCATKFNTAKRFGIEGVQSFVPGMKALIDELSREGSEKVICGMPHRGRLNFLANVLKKPLETIFAEF